MTADTHRMLSAAWSTLTPAERFICEWQFGLLGEFRAALMTAIARADDDNRHLLMRSFPMEVYAFTEWQRGTMGQFLRSKGIDI